MYREEFMKRAIALSAFVRQALARMLGGGTEVEVVGLAVDGKDALEKVKSLKVRSDDGHMIPLRAFSEVVPVRGPVMLTRYNMYPAAPVNGTKLLRIQVVHEAQGRKHLIRKPAHQCSQSVNAKSTKGCAYEEGPMYRFRHTEYGRDRCAPHHGSGHLLHRVGRRSTG